MAFVHLHVHSQYSMLDGTMTPKKLAAAVAGLGQSAAAITDTGALYGGVAFAKACKDVGVHAILGAELHVRVVEGEDPERAGGGFQILALVEDATGYRNLCALLTTGIFHGMRYKPTVSLAELEAHREGLIVLTGGLKGAFGRPLRRGRPEQGRVWLAALRDIFGPEHVFVELVDHGLEGQEAVNEAARGLAASLGLKTVVTNAVHYARPSDAPLLDALHAIAAGASLSDPSRPVIATDQAYLKSEDELREVFPDDGDAIDRTSEIAARCTFTYDFKTYHFPATTPPDPADGADTDANWAYFYRAFPPPRSYRLPDPGDAGFVMPARPEGAGNLNGFFAWYAEEGLKVRFQHIDEALHAAYRERLVYEIAMIIKMGFPAYLLIVAEFINWSKDAGIPVGPGRGSAAGSLVAWAMGITDIDPIRFDLLFERFLNPERKSMPDIDVDFCQDRREEAIAHVREKYGTPLVSQIITYGSLKAKAAVRDIARVLDLSFNDADRMAKLIPEKPGTRLKDAVGESELLQRMQRGDPRVQRVLALALGVEDLTRQTGVHAAGVVIADQPLVTYAPLYRDGPEGGPVVQYDMKSAESVGLIKFDFLGLKTLDQIRDAVAMVKANDGVEIDVALIPTDDAATFRLLQDGDALGVFQLESSGMRELLTRLRPTCLDDLVALVALYRPGPLSSGMVDQFVDRKHGRAEVSYPHPWLEPILSNTYGTIVYQEQVMQIARTLSGYSLGEADILRRAMGKKDAAEMAQQKDRFVRGAIDNAVDATLAADIFDLLAKFAEYGFNKSHSAAYGFVSYQTAYLKAHHRPEYMAALMTIEASNTDKVLMYLQDCRRVGLAVLPVDINRSQRAFAVSREDGAKVIRFGLAAVKNVGEGSIEAILAERMHAGPFRDVLDVLERVDPRALNKRVLESLTKAGAFDALAPNRTAILAGLDAAVEEAGRRRRDREAGQVSLFGGLGASKPVQHTAFAWPSVPEASLAKRLAEEREVLGLYLTANPMDAYRADQDRFGSGRLASLRDLPGGNEVRVLAVPTDVRVVKTKRGDKMAFVQIDDGTACIEAVFFSDAWARSAAAVGTDGPVLVHAEIESSEDGIKLRASGAEPLEEVRARTYRSATLRLKVDELTHERLTKLRTLFVSERGDCALTVTVHAPGRYLATFDLPSRRVAPSRAFEDGVAAVLGRFDALVLR
jgi:DNA polymerase-3 subunit alpha